MENTITTPAAVYFNNGTVGCWLDFTGPLKDDSSNKTMFACKHLVDACRKLSGDNSWRKTLEYILDGTPDEVKGLIVAAIKGGNHQVACDAMAEHLTKHHLDVYYTALGWGTLF